MFSNGNVVSDVMMFISSSLKYLKRTVIWNIGLFLNNWADLGTKMFFTAHMCLVP